jgi:hypothetical protein
VLYVVEMTASAASSLTEHENSQPQAHRRITKLAWVDVRTLLDAIRDGMVPGEARIKQGTHTTQHNTANTTTPKQTKHNTQFSLR